MTYLIVHQWAKFDSDTLMPHVFATREDAERACVWYRNHIRESFEMTHDRHVPLPHSYRVLLVPDRMSIEMDG